MVEAKVKYINFKTKTLPEYKMPYWDIDSGKEGPCFLVTAAIHGNEVQGSEAIRRFCPIAEKSLLKGRIVLVPFVNPLALWNRRPHIVSTLGEPFGVYAGKLEKDNLNRAWPGDPDGNESDQVAYIFFNDFFKKIAPTHYVDLHCYNRFIAACSIAEKGNPKSIEFAKQSTFPIFRLFTFGSLLNTEDVPEELKKRERFSLMQWVSKNGGAAFAVEFSGQYTLIEKEVERGVRMLSNSAKYIGVFEGQLEGMDELVIHKEEENVEMVAVRVPHQGLFIENGLSIGDYVKKGDVLGHLFNDATLKTIPIEAPISGYLYYYGSARRRCDVDLASMHPFVDKDGNIATIIREKPSSEQEEAEQREGKNNG
ncbi:succinylglutamate desuccinylase/aspartoacylase family protein [bacterium]|nr:succinylglutamate desuccinylase/aspartoacylase family protein [bacterium]